MKRIIKNLLLVLLLCSQSILATEFYVSINGSDKNDGKSEAKAWRTFGYAGKNVKAGDIVWIKAGNYGSENISISESGKEGNLISFIGYRNTPGDINSMYYSYSQGKSIEFNKMPLLNGGNRNSGTAINIRSKNYIVFKNLQIKNYKYGIWGQNSNNIIIDNVLIHTLGDVKSFGSGFGIYFNGENNKNIIKNAVVVNASQDGILLYGNNNLIENCKVYSDEKIGKYGAMDYYIIFRGNNNRIVNNYVERVGDIPHGGHGIGTKSPLDRPSENNLIENCKAIGFSGESFYFAYEGARNNIVRDCVAEGDGAYNTGNLAYKVRDGANNNLFDRCKAFNSDGAVVIEESNEEGNNKLASNNTWRNCVFYNIFCGIRVTTIYNLNGEGVSSDIYSGNRIENCTFYSSKSFIRNSATSKDNIIINSIFSKVNNYTGYKTTKHGWTQSNNNYFQNGFKTPSNTGNISEDPSFKDVSKGNFRLKSTSKIINKGKKIEDIKTDFDGSKRPQGKSHDIGAFEFLENTTSEIKANAGEDQTICAGEEVTLTASGGSSYSWSNGASTASITVSPTDTTTYTVTVSEGSLSDTDQVNVTVNSFKLDAGKDVTIDAGESVTLTASGADSYSWSTGATTSSITLSPTETKTYTITAIKDGCEAQDQVKVEVNAVAEIVEANAGEDQTICAGEEVTLTASGGSSYSWSNGASTASITVSPSDTTTYTIEIVSNSRLISDSIMVYVEDCSVEESFQNDEFNSTYLTVYPNPTNGNLNIQLLEIQNSVKMDIISLNGSIVKSENMDSKNSSIQKKFDLSGLIKGIYIVRLTNENIYEIRKILVI